MATLFPYTTLFRSEGAADTRLVTPRLPDATRVTFTHNDAPLGLTPDMDRTEIVQRLDALRATNRAAALAPYAARELGMTECGPFIRAALERNPVSRHATLKQIAALDDGSIYDGPSRLAQPDEVWNYGTGDGLEKCLLAANAGGGTEIRVADHTATLMNGETPVCCFPTLKQPRDRRWMLHAPGERNHA